MKNFANSLEYKEYMDKFEYIFDKKYFVKKIDKIIIDTTYRVSINEYNHTYNMTRNYAKSIDFHEIKLIHNDEIIYTDRVVWQVSPFFQYIKHRNENEYFISGSDLLDFSVYNITKNRQYKYIDEYMINDNYDGDSNNEFWYITKFIYNENNNLIAINGQDGMNCKTITISDFAEPEKLPYNCVNLSSAIYKKYNTSTCDAIEWLDDNSLSMVIGEELPTEILLGEMELKNILNNRA
jgi:hypothetical protein